MAPKKKCVVVTSFDENQPGYLDFSYRLTALANEYELSVISQKLLTHPELSVPNSVFFEVNSGGGKLGWLHYLFKSILIIRRLNPTVVVLLHSAVSPISVVVQNIPTCLYWNEHPSNLMHIPARGRIKQWLTRCLHQLLFLGAKKASTVMPIGEDHHQDLIRHGVAADKINMLYMGVSDDFAACQLMPQNDHKNLRLIYVGTINEARGRDVMLDSMVIVAKQHLNVTLTMVGADEVQLEYCTQRIKALGVEQQVNVVGRVSGAKIPAYLKDADAAICVWQPSPWNQFNPPTKLFEYLVAGLPVLANNIPTHTRYVIDGKNGIVFDYDADALAHAITRLYEQRAQLPALKLAAANSGQAHVWSKIEPMFLHTIKQVLNPI